METRVPAEPGFAPPPFKQTQCLSAQDAADPSRVLSGLASPGASGCTYTDKNYSGNTFTFSMRCEGSFAIESSGRVSFTAETMEGSMASIANVAGKRVETQSRISARRLGNC